MKFFGEPHQLVRFSKKNMRNGKKIGFRFDANGEYVTENKRLIQALKTRFKFEVEELPSVDTEPTLELIVDDVSGIEEVEEVIEEVKEEVIVEKPKKSRKK